MMFQRKSMFLGGFRLDSGGKFNFDLYFDLKYGWGGKGNPRTSRFLDPDDQMPPPDPGDGGVLIT